MIDFFQALWAVVQHRTFASVGALALLTACGAPDDDLDGDGVPAPEDCDDLAADVAPDALELCDRTDNDCDGAVDEDLPTLPWFFDGDHDGYGDGWTPAFVACVDSYPDYGTVPGDCNDRDNSIYPGSAGCEEV